MQLSELKSFLSQSETLSIRLESGAKVPEHFHITELGLVSKHFIDCGATVREEQWISFQVWVANDVAHRLAPSKLLNIINQSDKVLQGKDLEVEFEYQTETLGRYAIVANGNELVLSPKYAACLAQDACGVTPSKPKVKLSELQNSCCAPDSGCC